MSKKLWATKEGRMLCGVDVQVQVYPRDRESRLNLNARCYDLYLVCLQWVAYLGGCSPRLPLGCCLAFTLVSHADDSLTLFAKGKDAEGLTVFESRTQHPVSVFFAGDVRRPDVEFRAVIRSAIAAVERKQMPLFD